MKLGLIDISKIEQISELSSALSITEDELISFAQSKEKYSSVGMVHKQNGTLRMIRFVTNDGYRHLLKRISQFLYSNYSLNAPEAVHGFIKDRSIITNAQKHTQKKIVLNIDIKDFYNSITITDIENIFLELGFNNNIATILSQLVTYDGTLVTGFSTSPVLSNIKCLVMDGEFERIFSEQMITYTRYVDDLTFSSDDKIPSKKLIEEILATYGFRINEKKVSIYRRGGPQYVTGLSVVDSRPRLSKRVKRSIRLELYFIRKYGFHGHLSRAWLRAFKNKSDLSKFTRMIAERWPLKGYVSFLHPVEPILAHQIYRMFSAEFDEDFD